MINVADEALVTHDRWHLTTDLGLLIASPFTGFVDPSCFNKCLVSFLIKFWVKFGQTYGELLGKLISQSLTYL